MISGVLEENMISDTGLEIHKMIFQCLVIHLKECFAHIKWYIDEYWEISTNQRSEILIKDKNWKKYKIAEIVWNF
jgi:hypothetical protein